MTGMTTAQDADGSVDAAWGDLVRRMTATHPDIVQGRMMTADALTFGGKVFVFRSRRNGHGLGCKLAPGTDPGDLGATAWRPLQPFRDKAPMRDWYVIGPADRGPAWDRIAAAALSRARAASEGGA